MAGKLVGSNENDELYRGIITFMIIGLQESVLYVVRALPEIEVKSDWLKDAIKTTLLWLHESEFVVSEVCLNLEILFICNK